MTIPAPGPPSTVGAQPKTADEVNVTVGMHLRDFLRIKTIIGQDGDWLSAADLKVAPYYFTEQQETDLKTAVLQLDTAFDAIDMTFINRIIGLG